MPSRSRHRSLLRKGSLLRVLANRCSLCRQLIGDSAKMKIHWQRTHAPEWKRVSSSSIAGSRSLSAVFSSPLQLLWQPGA